MIEKNKRIKKRNKSMALIFLLLLGISSGFAYLTSNLSIFGSSILKGQKWDVHFENVQVSSEGVQIEKPEIVDKTTVEYNITLDKPGDFVEFTVDAKNDGTIDAMISTFDEIKIYEGDSETPLNSIPDYLDYSVTYADYEDVPIAENHLLKSGKNATYKVHVEYKKDITKDNLVNSKKELKAEFDVEYVQADDNAISYNQHASTSSTLSKDKLYSFGEDNRPKEMIFLDAGVSDSEDEKYKDISEEQDSSILAWMDGQTMYVSAKEKGLYVTAPVDSSYLLGVSDPIFDMIDDRECVVNWPTYLEKIDLTKLNTTNVTKMSYMFHFIGQNATTFELNLSGWDTSNVTDMSNMFYEIGENATTFKLEGLDNWDTSSVTDMNSMFCAAGTNTTNFELDLSEWDTSKVTDMSWMFSNIGYRATTWSIGDIGKWDTSSVENMRSMFQAAGCNATTIDFDLSGWDTSSVTNMAVMFAGVGEYVSEWNIGDISGWDTSKVTSMYYMFGGAGEYATTFELNISGWDTSSVIEMSEMFKYAGAYTTTFKLDISGWDTSNVVYMSGMFKYAGRSATTWSIGDISGWDTSNVKDMYCMFSDAGMGATEWNIGDISGWDTSKVTDMGWMFSGAGYDANYSLDLSSWNVDNVTKYSNFNAYVTKKITSPNWVN